MADSATTYGISKSSFGTETDPLARPFFHSLPLLLTMSISTNVIGRLLFHHHPKYWYAVDAIESYNVINNEGVLSRFTSYWDSQKNK